MSALLIFARSGRSFPFVTGSGWRVRKVGEDIGEVFDFAAGGALFEGVADFPCGDLGREGDGNDRVHGGALAAGHFFGLADEEVGDGGGVNGDVNIELRNRTSNADVPLGLSTDLLWARL